MKRLLIAVAVLALAAPAAAGGSYRVVLSEPEGGKLLIGHAGVQAADERNSDVHIRVISPGNEVKERGTVRVLVMNYGSEPFQVGPDEVKLQLADGTVLAPTPRQKFLKGHEVIRYQMNIKRGIAVASGYGCLDPRDIDDILRDPDTTGDHSVIDGLDQLLVPLTIGPNEAWGGYYVFDVPKSVFDKRTDQPLTITVQIGADEHHFPATLHWKGNSGTPVQLR